MNCYGMLLFRGLLGGLLPGAGVPVWVRYRYSYSGIVRNDQSIRYEHRYPCSTNTSTSRHRIVPAGSEAWYGTVIDVTLILLASSLFSNRVMNTRYGNFTAHKYNPYL